MLLPQTLSSWLSYRPLYESELSFTQSRRGLRRFVLEHIIFHNSADNAEFVLPLLGGTRLEKMARQYEPVFRIAA